MTPSPAQSHEVTKVPTTSTIRPAVVSAGSGTWPVKSGSRTVHRQETVAWETPNSSAAAPWTGFCRSRNSTNATDLYRPGAHIRPGTTGGSGACTSS
ncbi:hypothetical protein ACR820_05350 [Streptomyces netropsis]